MPSTIETVLVCAAHPDDEVLGCGGSMARHAADGADVHVLILAQGLTSRGESHGAGLAALREAGRRAGGILGAKSVSFEDFPDNAMDSVARLEVTRVVESHFARIAPTLVYTHYAHDLNVDHVRTHECVAVACRPMPGQTVRELRFFEVPSATDWRPGAPAFSPDLFVDIGGFLNQKLSALREYDAEMRAWPHARSYAALEHLAKWRGALAGVEAAEGFITGRRIIGAAASA